MPVFIIVINTQTGFPVSVTKWDFAHSNKLDSGGLVGSVHR